MKSTKKSNSRETDNQVLELSQLRLVHESPSRLIRNNNAKQAASFLSSEPLAESGLSIQSKSSRITASDSEFTLEWLNINISTPAPESKQIIFNQSGAINSGKVMAVLGTSGSGKTTLLNHLSGYMDPKMVTMGEIVLGGVPNLPAGQRRVLCGYVLQEDILSPSLTVYETIYQTAKFRFYDESDSFLRGRAEKAIELMGLQKCRDTFIGGGHERGISGGEKKRVAIAVELVSDPLILLLDEPTTGLDSINAENVVVAMRDLAEEQKVVISTIHQPSSEILQMFDELLILHQGRCIFQGHFEELRPYFKRKGVEIPNFTNPVEYILNVLNLDTRTCQILKSEVSEEFGTIFSEKAVRRMKKLANRPQNFRQWQTIENRPKIYKALEKSRKLKRQGFFKSLTLLFQRDLQHHFRDLSLIKGLALISIASTFLLWFLFNRIQYTEREIQNRQGLLYVLSEVSCNLPISMACVYFARNRSLLKKELLQGLYTPSAFFIGTHVPILLINCFFYTIYFPIIAYMNNLNTMDAQHILNMIAVSLLGMMASDAIGVLLAIIFESSSHAFRISAMVKAPLTMTTGIMISLSDIPFFFEPLKLLSPIRYVSEGLNVSEFDGLNGCLNDICDQAFESGYTVPVLECCVKLVLLNVFYRFLGGVLFHYQLKRYASLE